ncbi:Variable outer membrane protein (plasmid) [Borrelia nietonii YOR]|uniref:Variable outer membrane protein n=1 Tax=Borrelia nietonii YOR TaxID=1293576 RepID=W5SB68_9SPIR|nr:Vsp/OspC family lipoprotein [Borrelia nietonii]AHH04339.1 Variable outer membrane protein [Borrelia nietonii YOR]
MAKSDGTVLDLAKISKKIKESVEFSKDVKEVHTLIKSIDELAKAIKKKIQADGLKDDNDNHNGSLVAGAFSVALDIQTKLVALETKTDDNELKKQVTAAKTKSNELINKLKGQHADLGKADGAVTEAHAKEAIKRDNATKDKGAKELGELNKSVDELLKAANAAVEAAIAERLQLLPRWFLLKITN